MVGAVDERTPVRRTRSRFWPRLAALWVTLDSGDWRRADPDWLALVDPEGGEHTAGELLARANQAAHALRGLGLGAGDTLAVLLPNGTTLIELFLAALQIGVRITPINWHLVGPEIAYILDDSEAKAFVADERFGAEAIRAVDEAGFPAEARFSVGAIEGFRPDRRAVRRPAHHRPRGAHHRCGHALHVGHHRPTQGRAPGAHRDRPERHGRADDLPAEPVRHRPAGRPRPPHRVAALPHGRPDVDGQRAARWATPSCSWTSGPPRTPSG